MGKKKAANPQSPKIQSVPTDVSVELSKLRDLQKLVSPVTHGINNLLTVLFCKLDFLTGASAENGSDADFRSHLKQSLDELATRVNQLAAANRDCLTGRGHDF